MQWNRSLSHSLACSSNRMRVGASAAQSAGCSDGNGRCHCRCHCYSRSQIVWLLPLLLSRLLPVAFVCALTHSYSRSHTIECNNKALSVGLCVSVAMRERTHWHELTLSAAGGNTLSQTLAIAGLPFCLHPTVQVQCAALARTFEKIEYCIQPAPTCLRVPLLRQMHLKLTKQNRTAATCMQLPLSARITHHHYLSLF